MKMDNERFKADSAEERLDLWSKALGLLARENVSSQLVSALEAGDRERFEALLEPTGLFQIGGCIDIVDTITKVINFGPGHYEERCEVVPTIYIFPPSDVNGRLYRLSDGTVVFISERLWFDYHKRALEDLAWREANKSFLRALGILKCYPDWVTNSKLVSIERARTICFPTVVSPY
jgi:hypothetical protein